MRTSLFIILSLWISPALAEPPTLTVERLGEDRYELYLVTDQTIDSSEAQLALWPAAKKLCAGKIPRLGKCNFKVAVPSDGKAPAYPGTKMRQQIHCDLAAAPSVNLAPLAVVHDDNAIEQLTKKYLDARDTENYAEAYAFFDATLKADSSFESWREKIRSFYTQAGKAKSRRITKITWYDNPSSAPVPGVYAAADFQSEFEDLRVHCGYIVWHAKRDGSLEITREEESYIDSKTATKMSSDMINAFAQRYHCEARQ